jgi:hypothetical protein
MNTRWDDMSFVFKKLFSYIYLFIYLFIYCVFHDALGRSDYVASNGRMISK